MSNQQFTASIELPSSITQRDIWDVEEKLQQLDGVSTDLLESKDFATVTILILHYAASIMGPIGVVSGGIKSIHEVAKILYEFLHHTRSEKMDLEGKKKVIIVQKGKRIEIYNLSIEEIEKILGEK